MAWNFQKYISGLFGVAVEGFAITPADADLAETVRYLYVGTGGTVVVQMEGLGQADTGATLTFVNVPNGFYLWGAFKRVNLATTATNILGFP